MRGRVQTHVRRFTRRVEGVDSISMKVLAKVLPDAVLQRISGPQCVIADTHKSMLICVCELDDFANTCAKVRLPFTCLFYMAMSCQS